MSPAAVVLQEVTRTFGPRTVLRGIDAEVEPGEVVAVYGRSGSGKTTLLNLIGGLDRPDHGTIRVGHQDLTRLSAVELDRLRRTRVGFVFQTYGLIAHLSAWANVEFALRLCGCPRREWRGRTRAALEAVGLSRRSHHLPAELSGGERQRVSIARVLAMRPALVLADEPTGALDLATAGLVMEQLVALAREAGTTVWIGTHDPAIRRRVDRAFRLVEGRLAPE